MTHVPATEAIHRKLRRPSRAEPRESRVSAASLRRDGVIGASASNVLTGVWLVVAPWVLGYTAAGSTWNDLACGAVIALLALTRILGAYRLSWLSLFNALIGAWLVAAAVTIDGSGAFANDAIVGMLVSLRALKSAFASDAPPRPRHDADPAPRPSTPPETAGRVERPRDRPLGTVRHSSRTHRSTQSRPAGRRHGDSGCADHRAPTHRSR
jgi:SPW repeat